MDQTTTAPERAFVLGLDGIPWDSIERWAESGDLPHFAELMAEGAAGTLRSTVPPTTPLAWPSIATGTWPAKHGIYGFQHASRDYSKRMITSDDIHQPELWDVVTPALVGNVPMTYPADAIDGMMVTGMMSPSINERFTHPPAFRDELVETIPDYKIGLQWSEYRGREAEFLPALTSLVDARRKLMRRFMAEEDWRLFFFVYTAPDRLQHLIWDDEVRLEHYQLLDDILGEVMAYTDEHDALLFVVSDHGFGPITKHVYLNRILEESGHQFRSEQTGTRGLLQRLHVDKSAVKSALGRVGITDRMLDKYLPKSVVDTVARQVPGEHHLYDIDHDRTEAFALGSGAVYINSRARFSSGIIDPQDLPEVKREVMRALAEVVDPDTGDAVLKVYDGEELYPDDPQAPDIVVSTVDGYEKAVSLSDRVFVPSADLGVAATHRSEGIFLARGGPIQAGSEPVGATVVDVAPTLLHCLGLPVGETMDGRVLTEILHPDSDAARATVTTAQYAEAEDGLAAPDEEDYSDVEERLRGLGYME
ncbi:alkaline phosphatase family protein [Halorarius litoreus]|uniref:alkaline phosphatase family protein n=1 Tax=Halorarius litoreus TaxID=2962676 RepID=UPI0020CC481C|nr:alkaline phosphatase family protein [Halorarius litoreus]